MNIYKNKTGKTCDENQCKTCSPCIASKIALVFLALMALTELWKYFA